MKVDKSSSLASIVDGATAAFFALMNALNGWNGRWSSRSRKTGILSMWGTRSLLYKKWKMIRRIPAMRVINEDAASLR
jgi:hypothetical protein